MTIDQEQLAGPGYDDRGLVNNILDQQFELQTSDLDTEQVTKFVMDAIQALSVEGTKLVSIIGGPASGKSTLVKSIIDGLAHQDLKADSVGTDDYNLGTRDWRWERERDDPISLKDFELLNRHVQTIKRLNEGETLSVPVYDQPTGLAIEAGEENFPHKIGKVNVLFVEGDFDALENPDLRIFTDVPMEARMQIRIDRDLRDRGEADAEKIANSFRSRHEKQYIPYTAPALEKANLVLKVEPSLEDCHYDVYQAKS